VIYKYVFVLRYLHTLIMKLLIFSVAVVIVFTFLSVKAQQMPSPVLSSETVTWDSVSKSFEAYAGDKRAQCMFNFTNVSAGNIKITSVVPSCGCTTVQMPPLPWTLTPNSSGQIGVTINIEGKSGTLSKYLAVTTDQGAKLLYVNINIVSALQYPLMSQADRIQNIGIAKIDRQAVFEGDCTSCHAKEGEGKLGKDLYLADCAICHDDIRQASVVPDLHLITVPTDANYWVDRMF
jgi:hypothetical protein